MPGLSPSSGFGSPTSGGGLGRPRERAGGAKAEVVAAHVQSAPRPLIPAQISPTIAAMAFETGKAQIDEVLRQIRNGERKQVPPQPPDPMREVMEAAYRIGSRWGKDARRKRGGR